MKARTKGKELMKVAAICVLSIGLFSASFLGFNQLIFAAATSEPTPLPPAVTTVAPTQNTEQSQPEAEAETFTAPTLTLIESPDQHFHSIPVSAMPMEEAAQIGARYIWDVFGTDIDGMYMQMMFAAHASQTNTWWVGQVFVEDPANPTQNYFESSVNPGERHALPVYMFTVNGITGERIDISYDSNRGSVTPQGGNNRHDIRMALVEAGWFDMDIYEQIAFVGLSCEEIEAYTQTATRLAEAQFNIVGVADVQLVGLNVNGMIDGIADLAALSFSATDNTGRDAHISIPHTDAASRGVRISTQHNDFMPGFEFHDDGSGRG